MRRSLLIAAILGLAKADPAASGVVAPPPRKADVHVTPAQLGLLASLAAGTEALAALPAGTLVDRRHRVLLVSVALVGWSLSLGLAGFAQGLALLEVTRVLSGGIATAVWLGATPSW